MNAEMCASPIIIAQMTDSPTVSEVRELVEFLPAIAGVLAVLGALYLHARYIAPLIRKDVVKAEIWTQHVAAMTTLLEQAAGENQRCRHREALSEARAIRAEAKVKELVTRIENLESGSLKSAVEAAE